MQLLGHAGLRQLLVEHTPGGAGIALDADDDEEEDVESAGFWGSTPRRTRKAKGGKKREFPPVPNEEGRKLMDGGIFGAGEDFRDRSRKKNKYLARNLMMRELGMGRYRGPKSTRAISQVCISYQSSCLEVVHLTGRTEYATVGDGRHYHPLRYSMLLWPILRRWKFLLFLRSRFQRADVRHI